MIYKATIPSSELESMRAALLDCSLFAEIGQEELESVINRCQRRRFTSGASLFQQGSSAQHFYLLESGLIKLTRESVDGKEKILDLISSGNTFAEALMFSSAEIYPVKATAIEPSVVFCIDSHHYRDLLSRSTKACFKVMAKMSVRLHGQIAEIDRLALHSASSRLAYFLCENLIGNSEQTTHVRLEVSKRVLASQLSITPETLSRLFARFQNEDIIDIRDGTIMLLNEERLREFIQLVP